MAKYKDLINKRFGNLLVVRIEKTDANRTFLKCRCLCGKETIVRADHIVSGHTKSCGCISKMTHEPRHKKHGLSETRIYHIWLGIKQRCYDCKSTNFYKYGLKGIGMYDEWKNNFSKFYEWSVKNGYNDNLTIDRIDNNKGYSPQNCRWATLIQQGNNKRNNIQITFNGITKTISYWAIETGLSRTTIYKRIRRGWSIKDTLTKPKMKNQFLISK